MTRITKFYLNKASYLLGDSEGNQVEVIVDYADNKFRLGVVHKANQDLSVTKSYARKIVKDLLRKKSRVNLVTKLLK